MICPTRRTDITRALLRLEKTTNLFGGRGGEGRGGEGRGGEGRGGEGREGGREGEEGREGREGWEGGRDDCYTLQ